MIVTPFFKQHLLNYAFRGTPFPFPTDRYLSLWMTLDTAEVTDAAYERLIISFGPWVSPGPMINSSDRLFAAAAAQYTFQYLAITDTKTGGNILMYKQVNQVTVSPGLRVRVKAGQIQLNVT